MSESQIIGLSDRKCDWQTAFKVERVVDPLNGTAFVASVGHSCRAHLYPRFEPNFVLVLNEMVLVLNEMVLVLD